MSTDARQLYGDDFRRIESEAPGRAIPWLHALRTQALDQFLQGGLPTPRHEDWKYTDVRAIDARHFVPAPRIGIAPAQVQPFLYDTHALVFVDGFYMPELSGQRALPAGVHAVSLMEALSEDAAEVEPWFTRQAPRTRGGFGAMNAALMQDGVFLHIGPRVVVEQPIQLLFISTAKPSAGQYLKNLIVAEAGSRATVVESYVALGEGEYLTNAVTNVTLDPQAQLDHYRLEREAAAAYHIGSTQVQLRRDSAYRSHSVTLGGAIARHELICQLEEEGAQCALNGLYVGHERQHMDHHTRIEHRAPRGTSREWYRGILNDRARGIFSGRVVVHPQAQHTDAEQSNHSLVLSPLAEADSRPQFEINADDVKCAHGATTGRLDPEALFYLRARGLDEQSARQALVYAFAADVLGRMQLGRVRVEVEQALAERLLGGRRMEELVQ